MLHDVCLEARPGEMIAIVGPTGAGKSTLVSLVPRFFDPWQGCVSIDGHDLRSVQIASVRRRWRSCPRSHSFFQSRSPRTLPTAAGRRRARKSQTCARAANAHEFISRLPRGYDTLVGERGATLSGGERQRVSIARALLLNAPILLLDEPTSALDAETERLMLDALDRLMAGRTTLIIAHRLSTIRRADRIVVLRDGRVVESGTHHELLGSEGLYRRLHDFQMGADTLPTRA